LSGHHDAARQAYEYAIAVARSDDANFLMKSIEYEVGLSYAALAELAQMVGEDPSGYAAERDAVLRPLGVLR
jgi:hypothetical protein